jgi:hypothetical protein
MPMGRARRLCQSLIVIGPLRGGIAGRDGGVPLDHSAGGAALTR